MAIKYLTDYCRQSNCNNMTCKFLSKDKKTCTQLLQVIKAISKEIAKHQYMF